MPLMALGCARVDPWLVYEVAKKTIEEFRPKLFVEFHEMLPKLLNWLHRLGYTLHRQEKNPHGERYGWILALPDEGAAK
jgi:hypothetical protein